MAASFKKFTGPMLKSILERKDADGEKERKKSLAKGPIV